MWQSPTACAVAEPHATYTGETRFPLIVQNTHRYFFYIAGIISVINTYDAIIAFQSPSGFGFGLGNVILVVNVILLWVYTLSCHSCRHVVGGRLKHFSKHPVRYWMWTQVSRLNTRHKLYAWITLGHADADRLLHHAGCQRHHLTTSDSLADNWLDSLCISRQVRIYAEPEALRASGSSEVERHSVRRRRHRCRRRGIARGDRGA